MNVPDHEMLSIRPAYCDTTPPVGQTVAIESVASAGALSLALFFKSRAPSESRPQFPLSAPASSPPIPPRPLPAPAPPFPNNALPRAHSHRARARQLESPAVLRAPPQRESSPAPAHSESSAETLSDRSPTPPRTDR